MRPSLTTIESKDLMITFQKMISFSDMMNFDRMSKTETVKIPNSVFVSSPPAVTGNPSVTVTSEVVVTSSTVVATGAAASSSVSIDSTVSSKGLSVNSTGTKSEMFIASRIVPKFSSPQLLKKEQERINLLHVLNMQKPNPKNKPRKDSSQNSESSKSESRTDQDQVDLYCVVTGCDYQTDSRENLEIHSKLHRQSSYVCQVVGCVYRGLGMSDINKHMKLAHGEVTAEDLNNKEILNEKNVILSGQSMEDGAGPSVKVNKAKVGCNVLPTLEETGIDTDASKDTNFDISKETEAKELPKGFKRYRCEKCKEMFAYDLFMTCP